MILLPSGKTFNVKLKIWPELSLKKFNAEEINLHLIFTYTTLQSWDYYTSLNFDWILDS